jgi:S-adenosylmethionine-diacylgycerolhomoserine-N-methlytransferase
MTDAAARMDRMYRHQRYIYDLSRKFYLLGRDELITKIDARPSDAILEVACGTARNLVKLALAYPRSPCFGFDVSAEMLDSASRAVERAGLANRVKLAQGDATSFDPERLFGRARFERIVISYALSMIPPWRETLAHALDQLAPGGSLHVVDFGDQASLPGWFRFILNRWLAAFHVTPRADLTQVVAELAEERSMRWRAVSRFGGYAIYAVVERAS